MIKRLETQFGVNDLYKKSFIQVALWSWITALRYAAGWQRKDAIDSFQKFFKAEDVDHHCLGAHYNFTNNYFRSSKSDTDFDFESVKDLSQVTIVVTGEQMKDIVEMIREKV